MAGGQRAWTVRLYQARCSQARENTRYTAEDVSGGLRLACRERGVIAFDIKVLCERLPRQSGILLA